MTERSKRGAPATQKWMAPAFGCTKKFEKATVILVGMWGGEGDQKEAARTCGAAGNEQRWQLGFPCSGEEFWRRGCTIGDGVRGETEGIVWAL